MKSDAGFPTIEAADAFMDKTANGKRRKGYQDSGEVKEEDEEEEEEIEEEEEEMEEMEEEESEMEEEEQQDEVKVKSEIEDNVYCFTGFRDKDLESKIIAAGGKVAASVTKAVTVVVYKTGSEGTKKVQDAEAKGLKIVTKERLEEEMEGNVGAVNTEAKTSTSKASSSSSGRLIYLECTEGNSDKFYELKRQGTTVSTRYGRR